MAAMEKKSGADSGAAARAKRLHNQIEKLKGGGSGGRSDDSDAEKAPPNSPREFIQKRMRELDKKKNG
jgi:hypothetical protein